MALKTRNLTQISMHIALIAICAQISFPLLLWVPFTLQILGIVVTARNLSPKDTLITLTLYLLLGLLGLPIFAGGTGGLHMLMMPTFGFIIGFIPFAYFISKNIKLTPLSYLILYVFGLGYLLFILRGTKQIDITLMAAIQSFMIPFLITDLSMIGLGIFISNRLSLHLSSVV